MKHLLSLTLMSAAAASANATVYNFSYTRVVDNKVVAGQLNGTLQSDNNTVVVSSLIGAPTLSGVAGPVLNFLSSTDRSNFGTAGLLPRVSLNGTFMDFIACDFSSTCNGRGNAFTFNAGNVTAATFGTNGQPFDAYDGFYGAFSETYSAARWSLTAAPVPEPSSWALLAGGCVVLAGTHRRRRTRSAQAA